MTSPRKNIDREGTEVRLLLEGIFETYGFDFRDYAPASIRRRIQAGVDALGTRTITGLLDRVFHDPESMQRLLLELTVHVTAMFRDPGFYLAFRREVVPLLRTYPFVRIWIAGCSTGEEVYSLAILLQEEGIYPRCRLYATDLSEAVLRKAREALFPLAAMQEYSRNYQEAGGREAFSQYYTALYDHARFRPALQDNVVFAPHNLVTDRSFNEFQVILCRNVMIYFNESLLARTFELLDQSLARLGVLALGSHESIRFTPYEASYKVLDPKHRLYRKQA
jgi:chemotaxis protein methyltransferase CheR